jgi:putative DNA primase/helicase
MNIAELRIWVAWQNEPRGPSERPTKIPYSAVGRRASSTDPARWLTRDQAERCRDALPLPCGDGGIGLMLGVDIGDSRVIVGVDLDTCREPDNRIEPWATEVIERFKTYTEISPSGTGAKIFGTMTIADLTIVRAMLAGKNGRHWKRGEGIHPPGFELHVANHYFTATGEALADAPAEMCPVDLTSFEWLVHEAGPAFVGNGKAKPDGKAGRDDTRSAKAFRLAQTVHQAGNTYDDFVDALQAEPELAGWYAEKGQRSGEREAKRA